VDLFYTYKRTFAIQLPAVVDSDYKFFYVDAGWRQGRLGDAGIYLRSSVSDALRNGLTDVPTPQSLPQSNDLCPFVLVANGAYN